MSVSRVTLEVSPDDGESLEGIIESLWEALRDAGLDSVITVVSVDTED